MKHSYKVYLLFIVTTFLLVSFFTSCGSVRSQSNGLENVAYLQIEGSANLHKSVTIRIDDSPSFEAKVNDVSNRSVKNEYSYKIPVGSHIIKVFDKDELLVSKKIFTPANQVNIVEVP